MYRCQGMFLRNQSGIDPDIDAVTIQLANGEKLDDESVIFSRLHVVGSNGGNTFAVNVINRKFRMECQRSNYGSFGRRIIPLNIGGRICFGISKPLSFFKDIIKLGAGCIHLVEDKIGGAVHNAQNTRNFIAC